MSSQRKQRKAQQAEVKKATAEMLGIRRDLEQA